MPIQHLVVFGDSWPAGAELESPATDAFPTLIANQLGIELTNLAEPGTSIDQAVYKLLQTSLNFESALILFCLTGISRSMYIDGRPREIHPTADNPRSVAYYKYIHSTELDKFNCIRNVLSVQQHCQALGYQVLFVNNWDKVPKHSAINENLFYNKTLTEILNINQNLDSNGLDWYNLSQHKYIIPNKCHPNTDGHSIIATELSSWIKEKLNDKPVS